jgi:hypothetical protein
MRPAALALGERPVGRTVMLAVGREGTLSSDHARYLASPTITATLILGAARC